MCRKPLIQPLTQEEKDRLNGKYGQLVNTKSAADLGYMHVMGPLGL